MNCISIIEPRWSTKDILVRSWDLEDINQVVINHHEYPNPYYITKQQIQQYPTKPVANQYGFNSIMHVIPLEDLDKYKDLVLETL